MTESAEKPEGMDGLRVEGGWLDEAVETFAEPDEIPDPKPKRAKRARKAKPESLKYFSGPIPSGARGEVVGRLQERLGVPKTLVLDRATSSAVRRLQKAHRLPQTGRVDARVRSILGV